MIATGRYLKGYLWFPRNMIHLILGIIILVITFYFCSNLPHYRSDSTGDRHTSSGRPVLILIVPVCITGYLGRIILNKCKWKTRLGLRIKLLHYIISYIIIIIGTIANITGIYSYRINKYAS